MQPLILASQSPRRAALVTQLGIQTIRIQPAHIDETMDATRGPIENVERLALLKARHVAKTPPPFQGGGRRVVERGIVLGADTTVVISGNILEKPRDAEDAERMLRLLSGNTHTVYTGVAIIDCISGQERSFVEATDVTFRTLSIEEIRAYIASGAPMDKAGAYGIQEDFGAVFVRRIEGDYYNVVGLPLCRLYLALKEFAPDLFSQS